MLYKENSFERLGYINHFLIMVPDYKLKDTLTIVFLWNPSKLGLLTKNNLNYILVSPLNSYQILSLSDKNIPIYYLNENKNFVPWNFLFLGKEEPFTIIFPDGQRDKVNLDDFKDFTEIIEFETPEFSIKKLRGKEQLNINVSLEEYETQPPSLFFIEAERLPEVIRIFRMHYPWTEDYKNFSLLLFELEQKKYLLIESSKEANEEIINQLVSISYRAFYPIYRNYLNIEYGMRISPQISLNSILENYAGFEIFVFKEGQGVRSFFFKAERKTLESFDKIAKYVFTIYEDKIREFLS